MENIDSLIISLLDSDAMKGCFKKTLSEQLDIEPSKIKEIWIETNLIDGMARQMLYVSFIDATIRKDKLLDLPFEYIYENCIVFKIGDTII